MRPEKVAQGRWQALSSTEKIFTVVVTLSLIGGFSLLALEASGLVTLL
ncbi:MAG TPA: hypothetical protein VMW37_06040 [Dehalococcoidales bacterium]|nr:hypothetical protein [Dehalococcoidales bacterium]